MLMDTQPTSNEVIHQEMLLASKLPSAVSAGGGVILFLLHPITLLDSVTWMGRLPHPMLEAAALQG